MIFYNETVIKYQIRFDDPNEIGLFHNKDKIVAKFLNSSVFIGSKQEILDPNYIIIEGDIPRLVDKPCKFPLI